MANTCLNFASVYGESDNLRLFNLEVDNKWETNWYDLGENVSDYQFESRWVAPVDYIKELSLKFSVLIECESEEIGCDYYCKFSYKNGELIYKIELPYLEGKYASMEWNEYVNSVVMSELDDPDPFDEFMERFSFLSDEHRIELEELFFEHSN